MKTRWDFVKGSLSLSVQVQLLFGFGCLSVHWFYLFVCLFVRSLQYLHGSNQETLKAKRVKNGNEKVSIKIRNIGLTKIF